MSGFQLFLEERQNGNQTDEDVLQSAMIEWKKLSSEEKQKWNNSSEQVKIDDPQINEKEKEIIIKQKESDGQGKEICDKGQRKVHESKKFDTKENIESKKILKQNGIAKNTNKIVEKTFKGKVKKTDGKVKAKTLTETKNIKPSTGSTATLKSFAFKKNDT